MSAGRIIGRAACPLCDHQAAHVKQSEGKHPYLYCPECGCTLAARNGTQAAHLMRKVRPDKLADLAPAPAPVDQAHQAAKPASPAPAPVDQVQQPAKPAKRQSPWKPLIGALS